MRTGRHGLRRALGAALAAVALLAVLAGCGADDTGSGTATTTAGGLVSIGAGLRGPSGLAATVFATGLSHVAALAVDGQGRVWAATAAMQDEGRDRLYVVGADGSPQKVVDGLHTPLGLLWVDDTLYVASAGRVEAFTGFDGTAFASVATVLQLPDGVGELNGLARAPAGRLVLGISSPCDSCDPESPYSAAVVSFAPDGSDLQVVASGIRAPIGLAYVPGTDRLLVSMNQRDDLGDATPGDWLGLVAQGQDWKFPDCYGQGGPVCAGVPDPVAELDTHAAVSGVTVVSGALATAGGTASGGTASGGTAGAAVVAEWARGVVKRVPLGALGQETVAADTLVAGLENPVPVLAVGDALLVGDWGTGRLYRIAAA